MRQDLFWLMALVLAATACERVPDRVAVDAQPQPVPEAAVPTTPRAPSNEDVGLAAALPRMVVHKSPTCGCCELWVEHMRKAGFEVEVRDRENLHPIKERLGVPYGHGSCHTAEVGGYFVEGHVPASDVKRLLAEKPESRGLVLPGMPVGSPGMEVPSGELQLYVVSLVDGEGRPRPYVQHGSPAIPPRSAVR